MRIRLGSGSPVKDNKGNIIGIHVIATIKKNKVGPPFRKCEFDIIFGKGIVEGEYVFDECRAFCDKNDVIVDNKQIKISGTSAWKELSVIDAQTGEVYVEKKFYKAEFGTMMKDPAFKPFIDKVIDMAYTTMNGDEQNDAATSEDDDEALADD